MFFGNHDTIAHTDGWLTAMTTITSSQRCEIAWFTPHALAHLDAAVLSLLLDCDAAIELIVDLSEGVRWGGHSNIGIVSLEKDIPMKICLKSECRRFQQSKQGPTATETECSRQIQQLRVELCTHYSVYTTTKTFVIWVWSCPLTICKDHFCIGSIFNSMIVGLLHFTIAWFLNFKISTFYDFKKLAFDGLEIMIVVFLKF